MYTFEKDGTLHLATLQAAIREENGTLKVHASSIWSLGRSGRIAQRYRNMGWNAMGREVKAKQSKLKCSGSDAWSANRSLSLSVRLEFWSLQWSSEAY